MLELQRSVLTKLNTQEPFQTSALTWEKKKHTLAVLTEGRLWFVSIQSAITVVLVADNSVELFSTEFTHFHSQPFTYFSTTTFYNTLVDVTLGLAVVSSETSEPRDHANH